MKSKFSYKSKRTIIIAAIITVLLAGTATGVYFFTKGNAQAQAAGDNNTTQEQYGEAPEENKNEQQNNTTENEQNKNEQGETTPNQQEEQETERQEQTTNNNQTTQNEQTTTTTTGEVPNQEYVTEREETVKNPWESLEVGWGPTQFASIASTANLTAKKSNLEIHKTVDKESVKIGDTLTYTISVKNNGDKVAKAIIYDNVPEGTVLLNKDNNEDENTKKLTWRVTVEPGETEKVEFTVRVKAEKGTIKNSAIVNGKTTNETETGIINITGKKEVDKAEAKVGDTLTYIITLTNNGNADGTVTVTDEIPTGTTLVADSITANGSYNEENKTITWTDVKVEAGKTAEVSFKATINNDTKTSVTNKAVIDGNKPTEEVETKVANITGAKSVDKSTAKVGDTLTYTITLTNNGNATGTVTVTDEIPTGTRIKDENTTGYNKETNTMTWSNVEVKANGETATLTLEVVVKDNTTDTVKNVAKIDNKEIPEKPETKVANITGTKTVDKTEAKVGDTLTYTIALTNNGNADGTVTVTDEVPTGITLVADSITANGSYNEENKTITWTDVKVEAGKTAEVSFKATINNDTKTSVTNKAVIDGNKPTEEVETKVANITGAKSVDKSTAKVGDTLTYTITLTNNGNADGTVTVTDEIPTGTRIKDENATGYNKATNTMTWSDVEVKAGKLVELTLEVVVKDDTTDTVKNVAKIDNKEIPEKPETKVANITGTKTVDKTEAKVGDTLTYTIILTNSGNADGTVTITDEIPTGTRIKDENTTGYNKETNTMTWSNVEVKAGKSAKLALEVVVDDNISIIKNIAYVDGNKIPEEPETTVKHHYTVEHYTENLDGTYSKVDKDTVVSEDVEIGTKVSYEVKKYEGFEYDESQTVNKDATVPDNNNLVVKLYYTRNSYKVTYEYEGTVPAGASNLPEEATYKYGASVTVAEDATAPGYTFSGWDKEDFTMPAEDVVIKGSFTANTDTQYKVEHYLQDLDGNSYTLKDTETLAGTTDTTATATPKQYPGFTYDSTVEGTKTEGVITGDGQLVLKLYYTRNNYKVTYEYEGTPPSGASALPTEKTYKYRASVTVAEDATAPGYKFSGWDHEDFTMPAEDVVIKGSFEARNDTKYRVEHYLENLNDEGFTLEEGKDYAATTDTKVTAEPKEYPGFTFDSTVVGTKTEGIVTGDGQLVLKLYYVRATYTYTIHYFYNGAEDEGKQEGPFQAKFGEKVNSYRDKSEEGKYTQYDITSSNKTEEAILVIGTGENFINVYYGTPEVSINKDVSSKVANVGDTLDYTITVSENRKLVNARNIKVTDNLPSELDVIADSITSGGKLNDAKTEIEWNIAELEKGNNVELKFTARIKPNSIGKTISNTANLGGTTSGDSNTVTTTVSELKAAVKEVKKGTTGKDAVNIVLVMDLSYSMKSNKTSDGVTRLEAAKTAATKFINSIYTKDPKSKVTVTVLTFNSANPLTTIKYVGTERCTNNDILHLHWNCKNIDGVWYSKWEENTVEIPYSGTSKLGFADKSNYTSLVEEINEITLPNENPGPGLGTNVSAALDLTKTTVADLEENHSENSNVVILLSDGAPTTSYSGNSSWNNYEGLRNQASEIKGNPITTEFYSIQFGTEDGAYDLLRAMSSNNTVYTSNSINSLVENFTNILDQNTTKDPIDTVNGKYTTTLSNPLVVDADNLITVTYKGTTLFTCKSLPSNGLTYDSTTKTITWDINAWNAVEDHTKVTTNDIVIQCYVER